MKPYVESGKAAEANLRVSAPNPQEQRLVSSVRGFEQVIRIVGVHAIVLTPVIGLIARSTETAAYVAINFLAVILTLDLLERNVKKALKRLREEAGDRR